MQALIFVNLFLAGILAGIEIAVHYGLQKPTLALEDKAQIVLRQGVILKLRWLVPAFFAPTLLTSIALIFFSADQFTLIVRLISLATLGIWIYCRIVGTVRINSATLEWDADNPPHDWHDQVRKAERLHIIGVWSVVTTWLCLLLASGILR